MPCRKRNTGDSGVEGGASRKSPMSLPALKMVASPWISAARTAPSSAALASASASSAYIARVIEFFLSRRLKVRVITPASVWTRMSLMGGPCCEEMTVAGRAGAECVPHEIETALAPEHWSADEHGGRAEHAAPHGFFGLGLEAVLDLLRVGQREHRCRVEARAGQGGSERGRVVEIAR